MGNLWKEPTKRAVKKIIPYKSADEMKIDFDINDDKYKKCAHCGQMSQYIWDIQGNTVIHACRNDDCINNAENVAKVFKHTDNNAQYLRQLSTMTDLAKLWKFTVPKPII